MALTATLYRFTLELSDITRGVYQTLDLRVAMHPSESMPYLLTRVMAYALNFTEGLEFSPGGLSDTESPAITLAGPHGASALAIEVGSPGAKRLHKAMKRCEAMKVYTYKHPDNLLAEMRAEKIHRADEIELYALEARFLDEVATVLKRDNRWALLHDEGHVTLHVGEASYETDIQRVFLGA